MNLPDDARQFRDLSLLHDTSLDAVQRNTLLLKMSSSSIKKHQIFVRGLLGQSYSMLPLPKNRAKTVFCRWLST